MEYAYEKLCVDIDRGELRPVYFFHGPEEYLKEQAVQDILNKLIPPGLREFNVDILYGDEADANEIIDRVATLPMMAPRRVVLVRDVHDLSLVERRKILEYSVPAAKRKLLKKLESDILELEKQRRKDNTVEGESPKELRKRVESLLDEREEVIGRLDFPFSHACLLLIAEDVDMAKLFYRGTRKIKPKGFSSQRPSLPGISNLPGRSTSKLPKEEPLFSPWLNDYIDHVVTSVEFAAPPEGEISNWVRRLASKYGKSIDGQAVGLLSQAIGADVLALNNEIAKLSIYLAERPEIQSADVYAVVGELRVRTVFDLCDAIVRGDVRCSMSLLSRLLEAGVTTAQIVGALRWRLGQMAGGATWPGGRRNRVHVDESLLEKAYASLYQAELGVNTGRQSIDTAMTLLVDQLCHLFSERPEKTKGFSPPRGQWTRD